VKVKRHQQLTRLLVFAAFIMMVSPLPARAECAGEDGGSSVVSEIRGGDTLILGDGRSLRLAGALIPRRGVGGDSGPGAREETERVIAGLLLGQRAALHLDAGRRDRYGRLLAQIFIEKDGQRVWVQHQIISSGLARVISSRDSRLCIAELLAAENAAREARRGYWGTGLFAVRPAGAEDLLAGLAQNYEIIEGRVENVAEVRGRTYLNFGRNWRRDFTAAISSEAARLFPGEADSLAKLKGRLVRVRGWVENVNGPSINLTHPEQLEILESGTASQR
jgi:endonuclease YncB( thermonuclease family)